MTYHFGNSEGSDCLYVCLDIPSVELPINREMSLSKETLERVPKEIMTEIRKVGSENLSSSKQDRLDIYDYEFGFQYSDYLTLYDGASVEEILRFASKGTEIALEILSDTRTKDKTWRNDKEIADFVWKRVNEELTTTRERKQGFHFVCNPVFLRYIVEWYLYGILSNIINENTQIALDYLYDVEKNSNFNSAEARNGKFLAVLFKILSHR